MAQGGQWPVSVPTAVADFFSFGNYLPIIVTRLQICHQPEMPYVLPVLKGAAA